jgi:protein TonB
MTAVAPRWPGVALVLALHGAALWGLWQHRLLPAPAALETLVRALHRTTRPGTQAGTQASATPTASRGETRATATGGRDTGRDATGLRRACAIAPGPGDRGTGHGAARGSACAGNGALGSLPRTRRPRAYPTASRRRGEAGSVVLRVELDEQGACGQCTGRSPQRPRAARPGRAGRRQDLALQPAAPRRQGCSCHRPPTLSFRTARKLNHGIHCCPRPGLCPFPDPDRWRRPRRAGGTAAALGGELVPDRDPRHCQHPGAKAGRRLP